MIWIIGFLIKVNSTPCSKICLDVPFFMKEIKVLVNQYGALIFFCVRLMSIYSVSTEKTYRIHTLLHIIYVYTYRYTAVIPLWNNKVWNNDQAKILIHVVLKIIYSFVWFGGHLYLSFSIKKSCRFW